MWRRPVVFFAVGTITTAACALAAFGAAQVRFSSFGDVQETLTAFGRTEDALEWNAWVRTEDHEVRARVDRGVEDSLSNLILYGRSFTTLARIDSAETALTPAGVLTVEATSRLHALVAALARAGRNERLQFAHEFLVRRGVRPADAEGFLAANLTRFALEQRRYREQLNTARQGGGDGAARFVQATLFDRRGLSVDTSLLPNYALEDTLRAMLRKGALVPGSVRSVAVVGPGLDFTDKRDGYDFYPIQTIQPFAVIDTVLRLGLGRPENLRVTTLDLNAQVNAHLQTAAVRARAAREYTIQLPRDAAADWTPQAIGYWEHFGELIGSPAAPVPAPKGVLVRAVAVQPKFALMIEPSDLNVVAQVADGAHFDLVVATNILVYYDRFEQGLAMAGISRMMNAGGVFLSNTVLPAQKPTSLEFLGRRSLTYSVSGSYGDDIVVYRRR